MHKRLIPTLFLVAYGAILVKLMVFKNMVLALGPWSFRLTTEAGQSNLVPFRTVHKYLFGGSGWLVNTIELAGNTVLLMPIGFLMPFAYPKMTWAKSFALAVATGLFIELTQVVFRVGIFDIDDVILNALGVLAGYAVFRVFFGTHTEHMAHMSPKGQWITAAVVACFLGIAGWWVFTRPPVVPVAHLSASTLAWPSFGQSAVGIVDSSALATHGAQTPVPTASLAKMITVLMVLDKKPLMLGQQGPTITMTRDDIALLLAYDAVGGSEIGKVFVGEQLSEYQMLEAILLPSANNMADSLAIWAYGSLPAYAVAANAFLAKQGLNDTHVGTDASGFDPSTVSTARDMARIGKLVMQNPVLAEIVGKQSVNDFPLMGTIKNTNRLLGQSGIVGIKTGNSDEQGGAYVAAARVMVDGKPQTIVTALMGASSLTEAMNASLPLVKSAQASIRTGSSSEQADAGAQVTTQPASAETGDESGYTTQTRPPLRPRAQ